MGDRHQFRAKWHDYNDGLYFVTACTYRKKHFFGRICNGKMQLTPMGIIVEDLIKAIPMHHESVELWNYVVMPNHIHMVINIDSAVNFRINDVGAQYIAPALTQNHLSAIFHPDAGAMYCAPTNFQILYDNIITE